VTIRHRLIAYARRRIAAWIIKRFEREFGRV
jgi:hypothetical protein